MVPGVQAVWSGPGYAFRLDHADGRVDSDHDAAGDLILYIEDIHEVGVISVCPDVVAADGLDQLGGDPDPASGFADAALQHETNS